MSGHITEKQLITLYKAVADIQEYNYSDWQDAGHDAYIHTSHVNYPMCVCTLFTSDQTAIPLCCGGGKKSTAPRTNKRGTGMMVKVRNPKNQHLQIDSSTIVGCSL